MEKLKMRFLLLLICCSTVFANESGNIMGVVKDLETEEPLIGANVIIKGTATGAATDYEGRYFIQGVEPGVISLSVSYIGYENKTINDIKVLSGETINKNIDMNKDVVSIKGVQVTAEKKTGSDIESLSSKQNALEMQDNISSDQISKSGDSHVADAVRRVTGVTIMEDKFLVVRGLGDRYSSAQLNSVGMPSPESDRRSVPLDLFSTALISGIDVAKSYRPDLPGAFGGGNVNIRTKLYPSRTIYKLKIGTGVSGNILPGDEMITNMSGPNDLLGFDFGRSRDIPSSFEDELISYGSIPETYLPDLLTPIVSNFTGDTIGWNSDPVREYLWFKDSYRKNSLLPNAFQNSIEKSSLPASTSFTYGTKYGEANDLEMGFLFDGNFSRKSKYNQERMDRYNAYNDPNDDGTVIVDPVTGLQTIQYDKILRKGFIGLDRDIYQTSSNIGMNFSFGLTIRKHLRFGLRNVYTHTSKDNFTSSSGMSGELTHDYANLYPGKDFNAYLNGISFNGEQWDDIDGDGIYDSNESYTDSNQNGQWDAGDSISVLDENGLLISQRYNEKAINLTTLSIENKFDFQNIKNEIDFKYTFGKSDMYEPFATKSEWEYVRDELDPRTGSYTLYLRNGSNPGVSYNSKGKENIYGVSYDHLITVAKNTKIKFGLKVDRKERDFRRRYLYMDYSLFSLATNDSITTSSIDDINGALDNDYWATVNQSDSTINEGLVFSEKTSGFDGYVATEDIDAAYLMFNYTWNENLQISIGGRHEDYSMTMNPYHPVLGYKPYTLEANGIWDVGETFNDVNNNGVWDNGELFEDVEADTAIINFKNSSKRFLPALIINYSLSEKSKIRSSFSKTVARAQFREYAPYVFQEFLGADETIGYPNLKNTTIQSSDIRYEYFPKGVELVSLGIFQKHFTSPIEESLIAASGLSYTKSWQNGKYADIIGIESELRKELSIIPSNIGFLFLNTNLSLSKSEVVLPDSVFIHNAVLNAQVGFPNTVDNNSNKRARPLQGQSNVVFNMSLNFKNRSGLDLNLAYNIFSKRLVRISNEVAGHFWERPFHSLNFVASKKIGNSYKISFKANNLLNQSVRIAHYYNEKYYTTQEYDPGRSFSISIQMNN